MSHEPNYWDMVANSPGLRHAIETTYYHVAKAKRELSEDDYQVFIEELIEKLEAKVAAQQGAN